MKFRGSGRYLETKDGCHAARVVGGTVQCVSLLAAAAEVFCDHRVAAIGTLVQEPLKFVAQSPSVGIALGAIGLYLVGAAIQAAATETTARGNLQKNGTWGWRFRQALKRPLFRHHDPNFDFLAC